VGSAAQAARAEGNTRTAERLYEKLRAKRYRYTDDPWAMQAHVQRVRTPAELDGYAGTCVDFAVAYASAALAEKVAPLLVVSWSDSAHPRALGHVWVALDVGRQPTEHVMAEQLQPPDPGLAEEVVPGVLSWSKAGTRFLRREATDLLLIDVTAAGSGFRSGSGPGSWDDATAAGTDLLRYAGHLVTIDVVPAQMAGATPFEPLPPEQRPALARYLPMSPDYKEYPGREGLLDRLGQSRGRAVVVGERGTGKSMLALQAAAKADGGFGWFVNGSSPQALTRDLALAHAGQRGVRTDDLNLPDLKELARQARQDLADSTAPWVVVVDNVDLRTTDPDAETAALGMEMADLLPRPQRDRGQLLIITTTDRWWAAEPDPDDRARAWWADNVVTLTPIDLVTPEALAIDGRPLFLTAFQRLASRAQCSLEEIAAAVAHLPPGTSAEQCLWEAAADLAPDVGQAAELASWCAADDLVGSELDSLGEGRLGDLCAAGLATASGPDSGRMHRLIGAAIREDQLVTDPAAALKRLRTTLAVPALHDAESLRTAGEELLDRFPPEPGGRNQDLGIALHLLGYRLDPIVGVRVSRTYFDSALAWLDDADLRRRADCLHVAARHTYQHHKDVVSLTTALSDVDRCIEMREQMLTDEVMTQVELHRSTALKGLILIERTVRQLKASPPPPDADRASLIATARTGAALVDSSLHDREALHAGDGIDEDLLRGRFNQGMASVNLAQVVPGHEAAGWLMQADGSYEAVALARASIRPAPVSQLAACDAGRGLVAYLRALLVPKRTLAERGNDLRTAAAFVAEALAARETIEPAQDGDEVAKTVHLQVKIAAARHVLATAPPKRPAAVPELLRQMAREIPGYADGLDGLRLTEVDRPGTDAF
jgi:hypothetical protein